MKIAIPTATGALCMHFGHCSFFTIAEVDTESKTIVDISEVEPPPHEPGVLPKWLGEMAVDVIITGGMGMRAQQLFVEQNIQVVVGAPSNTPREIIESFLKGSLETGENVCDH